MTKKETTGTWSHAERLLAISVYSRQQAFFNFNGTWGLYCGEVNEATWPSTADWLGQGVSGPAGE